ncbi:MAG: GGDEF domain-containing protein [Candidimonas sp.]|nr:GGDEF domain-containing protein [Candidimonas sp.]
MSVNNESPGFEARANILASEALGAQLKVLQLFLPTSGWLISWQEQANWNIVVAQGVFTEVPADHTFGLLDNGWGDASCIDRFYYRRVMPDEMPMFGEKPRAGSPCYLIMANLKDPDGIHVGRVLGFSHDEPGAVLLLGAPKLFLCLTAMAFTVALRKELRAAEKMVVAMQRDAFIDPLTGVLNRAGWVDRLSQIATQSQRTDDDAAIVVLDLDFLKVVNDTRGHAAGDDLLRRTAQTISSVLRATDAVGRLGGDEFGVVVQHATPDMAAALLGRLKQALAQVDIKISIGMALMSEAGSLKKTVHLADERMYQEKRRKPTPARNRIDIDRTLANTKNTFN